MTTITATPPETDETDRLSLWLALQASTDLVATYSPVEDRLWINPAGRALLGVGPGPIDLATLSSLAPAWVQRRVTTEVRAALEARGVWEGELAVHDHEGDVVPLSVVVVSVGAHSGGSLDAFAVVARDISERKAFEDQLEHQATHDPLTELPNRTLLSDRLQVAVARAGRRGDQVAVLFLDLDRFKVINDSMGHRAGDALLIEVGRRIEGAVRPGDTVARLGGDEFAVVCEDITSTDDALAVATRVEDAVAAPVVLDGNEVTVTTSVGVAISDGGGDAESLLRDADAAMYQAKSGGRARTEVFDAAMHVQVVDRLDMEQGLRRAIDRRQLRLVFQPLVDVASLRVTGVECLIRWEHPERGLLGPDEFLPLAEETGLIVPIGSWITATACRTLARLRHLMPDLAGELGMNVNVSARQLADPNLPDEVAAVLAETLLPPESLTLEVTETVLMDTVASGAGLSRLRELGVRLAVDDFGTGWSSLRYLRTMPVDVLKIDREFVAGLGHEPDDEAIVAAVIDLAHALGLKAVAEGVEEAVQLDRLSTMGCDGVQGRLLGRPMSEPDLLEALPAIAALSDAS